MKHFSRSLGKFIKRRFPIAVLQPDSADGALEMIIPGPQTAQIGAMIMQTSAAGDIWLRIQQPHSAYLIEDRSELLHIIHEIRADRVLWVIGFQNADWYETTLVRSINELDRDPGVRHFVYSWSGLRDVVLEPGC